MPTVQVLDANGKQSGTMELKADVFGTEVSVPLLHQAVTRELNDRRVGTHDTKGRSEVSGGGKKPWRQKGTGRAQVGEARNPLWRKGGTVFGPQPRSYEYQLPKKVEKGALRAALSQKLRDGEVIVVDALSVGEIKTKAAAEMLKRLGIDGKALLVDVKPEEKMTLSVRNLDGVRLAEQSRQRARRHGHAARRADEGCAGKTAGGVGLMKLTDVIKRPLITEKTTIIREDGQTLVFQVAMDANKIDIKRAVEQLLGSKVASVRTSLAHGKMKRQGKYVGRRSDWKKAYVKLREGEKLPEFLQGA
jgi:large subunit ribosomal protein L4